MVSAYKDNIGRGEEESGDLSLRNKDKKASPEKKTYTAGLVEEVRGKLQAIFTSALRGETPLDIETVRKDLRSFRDSSLPLPKELIVGAQPFLEYDGTKKEIRDVIHGLGRGFVDSMTYGSGEVYAGDEIWKHHNFAKDAEHAGSALVREKLLIEGRRFIDSLKETPNTLITLGPGLGFDEEMFADVCPNLGRILGFEINERIAKIANQRLTPLVNSVDIQNCDHRKGLRELKEKIDAKAEGFEDFSQRGVIILSKSTLHYFWPHDFKEAICHIHEVLTRAKQGYLFLIIKTPHSESWRNDHVEVRGINGYRIGVHPQEKLKRAAIEKPQLIKYLGSKGFDTDAGIQTFLTIPGYDRDGQEEDFSFIIAPVKKETEKSKVAFDE